MATLWYKAPVGRFLGGFGLASLIWGGLFYGYATGIIELHLGDEEDGVEIAAAEEPEADDGKKKKKRKWRKGKKKRRYRGEALTGDDLGGPGTRNLDVAGSGGEEQLRSSEIEAGFDKVFPRIRRCLILAADDSPVTGKLNFGLRIAGSGRVTRVNLRGPSGITKTEAGSCLRKAAKGMTFRSFDGPDMLVQYPITLD